MYYMRVENVFPDYQNALEREKCVQEAYTELQLIFYNTTKEKNKSHSSKEQIIDFRKGNR